MPINILLIHLSRIDLRTAFPYHHHTDMRTAGSRFDATSFIVAEKTPETHEARDVAMLEAQVLNGNKNEFYFIIFFEWGTMYGGGLR